jgi:2-succinyl-6-hydroxy-2,4-cyclohexadiene-1-carboxylate synthase
MRLRLVHGFTQTALSWGRVEARLPRSWDVQAIEIPDGLDFAATASAVGVRGGPGTWVGYSMGGRLCLRLALDRPDLVERLVLVSTSPGIRSAKDRAARVANDESMANNLEREGVAAFVDRWLDQRLFETLPRSDAMVEDRIRGNTVNRLTHQLRTLGAGAHEPMWDRLSGLGMPVLLVSGQWDRAYTDIARQMGTAIGGDTTVRVIEKAGHAVPLERPDELAQLLTSWLETA